MAAIRRTRAKASMRTFTRNDISVIARMAKGSAAAYTAAQIITATSISNGVISGLADNPNNPLAGFEDCYARVTVTPGTGGTYCYIYNPYFTTA